MILAKEGLREMVLGTLVLGALGALAVVYFWPLAVPVALVWLWLISFFRDPRRAGPFEPHQFYSPADGTVTEVTRLPHEPQIDGPAVRVGIFLSIFNVHINRSPCAATVRSVVYRSGKFLDARHTDSGPQNEANTLVLDPDVPLPGPIVVRQVAGKIARRIICHVRAGDRLQAGQRIGLIKFGSRTELIVPDTPKVHITAFVGQKVVAGRTVLGVVSVPQQVDAETQRR
jgi:phosphatidylserine decarboxylase